MNYLKYIVIGFILGLASCTTSDESEPEKTETAQEKLGRTAAEQIQATISSAELARQTQNQHIEDMEKQIEQEIGSK